MVTLDLKYISELVEKYSAYKSPNDTQKLLVSLGSKDSRTEEENKTLKVLVNAEKKLEQLNKARQAARDVLNVDKIAKRKADSRRKIIWGAALITAAQNNPQIAQMMVKLYDGGYIADKDKGSVIDDYNALKSTINNDQSAH